MNTTPGGLSRRRLGLAVAGAAAAATLPSALTGAPALAEEGLAGLPMSRRAVRFGIVGALQTGGLLNQLLAGFTQKYPYEVALTVGNVTVLYDQARAGDLDIVATHIGVPQLRDFVTGRFGRWPQHVIATSFTLIASPDDPAGIAGLTDPVEAFARIAQTRSPFVVNNLDSPLYLTQVLWNAAGRPDQAGWYLDTGLSAAAAAREAARLGGYTVWGLHPFLMLEQQQPTGMQALLYADSLFQRSVGTVVVNPALVRGVNATGALLLERFLVDPATQGQIRAFRHPAFDIPIFWPAAHHNAAD
jgi:tungstate transport system substrate-binding protein